MPAHENQTDMHVAFSLLTRAGRPANMSSSRCFVARDAVK